MTKLKKKAGLRVTGGRAFMYEKGPDRRSQKDWTPFDATKLYSTLTNTQYTTFYNRDAVSAKSRPTPSSEFFENYNTTIIS